MIYRLLLETYLKTVEIHLSGCLFHYWTNRFVSSFQVQMLGCLSCFCSILKFFTCLSLHSHKVTAAPSSRRGDGKGQRMDRVNFPAITKKSEAFLETQFWDPLLESYRPPFVGRGSRLRGQLQAHHPQKNWVTQVLKGTCFCCSETVFLLAAACCVCNLFSLN